MMLMVACTKAPDGKGDDVTDANDVAEVRGPVIEIGSVVNHPNGTQLRLERVTLTDEATVVELGATNGSLKTVRFGSGETYALTEEGVRLELISPFDGVLEAGDDAVWHLEFEPAADADELTLHVNQGGGASEFATSPAFELGPYSLGGDSIRPALPDPQAANEIVSHPNGSELQVTGVTFAPTRIGVRVRLSNAGGFRIYLSKHDNHYLLDDLGNRYPLLLSSLSVPSGEARAGVLSFAGRIHPQATSLELRLNDGEPDGASTRTPTLFTKVWSLDGETPDVRLPADLAPKDVFNHPNGTQIDLKAITFTPKMIEATVAVTNAGRNYVILTLPGDVSTWLEDDLGNRYPLVPPADNRRLKVEAGSGLEGTLVFSGRLVPDASTVMIVINSRGSVDNPNARAPQFNIGPYPVKIDATRPAKPAEAPVFAVGDWTALVDETLAGSEVAEMELILSNFNAAEVKEGILLTVADTLLFDFNRAELRSDARQTLAQIAELLRYYEGEPVLIEGHTDSLGGTAYNQDLSEQRAKAVLQALVADHDIKRARLSSEGRGETKPVAPNSKSDGSDDPDGRQRNRRVEVTILTDRGLPGR